MAIEGIGHNGAPRRETLWILAGSGHGPYIPCIPAILLARHLARGWIVATGARPCLDLIDLNTYRYALRDFDIRFIEERDDA
jgi:hypothetical protein